MKKIYAIENFTEKQLKNQMKNTGKHRYNFMIAFKLCSTCQICPRGILNFKSKRPLTGPDAHLPHPVGDIKYLYSSPRLGVNNTGQPRNLFIKLSAKKVLPDFIL